MSAMRILADRAELARLLGVDVSDIDLECRRGMPRCKLEGSDVIWFDVETCLAWCRLPLGSRTPYLRAVPAAKDGEGRS